MADQYSTLGGIARVLSPFKVPIGENAPLSTNVVDQREKPSYSLMDYFTRPPDEPLSPRRGALRYPESESNPLLDQIRDAIVQGRIRGAQ